MNKIRQFPSQRGWYHSPVKVVTDHSSPWRKVRSSHHDDLNNTKCWQLACDWLAYQPYRRYTNAFCCLFHATETGIRSSLLAPCRDEKIIQGFHSGPGTVEIDCLWRWFCRPGLIVWRDVFLTKKLCSKRFACLWKTSFHPVKQLTLND